VFVCLGWLASRIGGKQLFGLGVLCTAVLTILTPVSARISLHLLMFVRVLEGLCEVGPISCALNYFNV